MILRPLKIAISHAFVISGDNILYNKAQEIFLFSFRGRVSVLFHWIFDGLTVLLLKKYLMWKIEKKYSTWLFLQFYKPPDLGKKISTIWNVVKSEVYLTCINFWKFHDNLKTCLEVIRLRSWPENVKFSVKMQFFMFLTPWKICFWIHVWINTSESGHESVHIPKKPIFLFKFSNF